MLERDIKIRQVIDIVADKTEPDWIVEGILMRGAITFLTGESGSFKTFLAIDLANRLTTTEGNSWLNHVIDRKSRQQFVSDWEMAQAHDAAMQQLSEKEYGDWLESLGEDEGAFRVLYIMAESSSSAGLRQEAWMQTHGIPTSPHFWMVTHSIRMEDELLDLVEAWEESTKDKLDVVMVDTFSANTPGVDENSKQSLSPSLDALRQLKEQDKAVLVIHHGTKDGKAHYRGHSSIENDTDIRFVSKRAGSEETITLYSDRQKEFEDWMSYEVRVPVVPLIDDDGHYRLRRSGERMTSRAVEGVYEAPSVHDEQVEWLLTQDNGATTQQVADQFGLTYDTARKRLEKLEEAGQIVGNKTSKPYVYKANTPEPLESL